MHRHNWDYRAVLVTLFLSCGTALAQTPSAVIGGPPQAGQIVGVCSPANGCTGANNGTLTSGLNFLASAPWNALGTVQIQSMFLGSNAGLAYPISTENSGFAAIGIGAGAMQSFTATNSENVVVGPWAYQYATTANLAAVLGMHAGGSELTAPGMTLFGNDACRNCISNAEGGYLTALGQGAAKSGNPGTGVTVVGALALAGNAAAVIISGTKTTNDVISITLSASGTTPGTVTGLPITANRTASAGDTLATIGTALAASLNNSVSGPSYNVTATSVALSDGTVAVTIVFPGSVGTGWAIVPTTNVTGAATEILTVSNGSVATNTVAIGQQALLGPAMGAVSETVAVGDSAGQNTTTGSLNVLVGYLAGNAVTTSSKNVAVGDRAGQKMTTGAAGQGKNILVGYESGQNITIGHDIVAIGPGVGATCTTAIQVLILNTDTGGDCSSSGEANAIHIGAGGSTDILKATGTGTATTATVTLHGSTINLPDLPSSSAATTGTLCWTTVTGLVNVDTTVACLASDERLKNIAPFAPAAPFKTACEEEAALVPINYTWKQGTSKFDDDPGEHIGLGAFNTAYADERLIARGEDGQPRGWRQDAMIALGIACRQEQQKRLADLELRIAR